MVVNCSDTISSVLQEMPRRGHLAVVNPDGPFPGVSTHGVHDGEVRINQPRCCRVIYAHYYEHGAVIF